PDGAFAVIGAGNSALASAGTGDVLSGVIAALLAAGYDAFEAACLGAWMHGTAGERVSLRMGEAGLLARDLLDELGPVGLELQEANR
ncbi:MAG TPA: NAD(P)H-hydrate dehydratase, partial [Candidatus Krumholzibacteria bacterium]|nr:NAD(P)H-hydrate dehydratase [Candidatus Krumholzibacteria bacterium]